MLVNNAELTMKRKFIFTSN